VIIHNTQNPRDGMGKVDTAVAVKQNSVNNNNSNGNGAG